MDTFRGCYTTVFSPYNIETENAAAAVRRQEVPRNIYSTAQEGVPTAFLQWH